MTAAPKMRGYFGIGMERVSKPMNFGNLMRTAHAFGASFVFTVDPAFRIETPQSDTSKAPHHLPLYNWRSVEEMSLPQGCSLVGVELLDEAVDLPSFRHPSRAAYVLGPERGALTSEMVARCDFLVRIPAAFCVNVATAGAIVMYDRMISMGRFAERPVSPSGPATPLPEHRHGAPLLRKPPPHAADE